MLTNAKHRILGGVLDQGSPDVVFADFNDETHSPTGVSIKFSLGETPSREGVSINSWVEG